RTREKYPSLPARDRDILLVRESSSLPFIYLRVLCRFQSDLVAHLSSDCRSSERRFFDSAAILLGTFGRHQRGRPIHRRALHWVVHPSWLSVATAALAEDDDIRAADVSLCSDCVLVRWSGEHARAEI